MIVCETERLTIRFLTLDDAPFIVRLLNDPDFIRYIGDREVRTDDQATRYLRDGPLASYEQHGFGLNLVALRASGEPLGICGLLKRPELDHPDLGFAMMPQSRRTGYTEEASRGILQVAFESQSVESVLAITKPENAASARLLKKIGFRFVEEIDYHDEPTSLFQLAPAERS